jgi:hypothetical protein
MGWERIAENTIREAIRDGEFDNRPGAGTPLAAVLERARRA